MKNSILAFLLIFVLDLILLQFLPWWVIVLVAFVICYLFVEKKRNAFILSFLAGGFLWGIAAFVFDQGYNVPIAQVLGDIIDTENSLMIYLMPTVLGGLVSALGGLLGTLLRSITRNADPVSV